MAEGQQPLRLLAIGDSLTAGYYSYGLAYHPYAKHLSELFASAQIPVVIDQRGVSGERVLRAMVKRLETILKSNASSYDCILILGATNDLTYRPSAEDIFQQGLKPMYEMVLHRTPTNTKLAVMTILQIGCYSLEHKEDKKRQALNEMIRDYVANHNAQERICLVDLDKAIQYHTMNDVDERELIWDDGVHLTPTGYDQMVTIIFEAIKSKLTH